MKATSKNFGVQCLQPGQSKELLDVQASQVVQAAPDFQFRTIIVQKASIFEDLRCSPHGSWYDVESQPVEAFAQVVSFTAARNEDVSQERIVTYAQRKPRSEDAAASASKPLKLSNIFWRSQISSEPQ